MSVVRQQHDNDLHQQQQQQIQQQQQQQQHHDNQSTLRSVASSQSSPSPSTTPPLTLGSATVAATAAATVDLTTMPHIQSQQRMKRESIRITWDDLDLKKYYGYNMMFGATIDAIMYPLDMMRTRMQVQGSSIVNQTFPVYNSTFHGIKNIYSNEGIRGFYKGFFTSEFGYLFSRVIYFGCYEKSKQYLAQNDFGPASAYIAGGLAELSGSAISVPFDVTTQKCQIQGHLGKTLTPFEIFRQTYNDRGVRGLYRGFGITIMRNVPYSAVWWGVYETTKIKLAKLDIRSRLGLPPRVTHGLLVSDDEEQDGHHVENEDPFIHMLAGLTAAIITTTLSNPLDVIKTRLQTSPAHYQFGGSSTSSNGSNISGAGPLRSLVNRSHFLTVFFDTIQKEGAWALWKGLTPALMTSAPYAMFSILVYEHVKKLSLK
ncbi:hypothetical protein SAMD00019534_108190 [Acytostelium subglobosum LB1]|uniref:hypothetical protein n=1 Tax=Acytostelium subglobosum LB1 TaxID=1410327 RepID=UPI000644C199|nr:hypothetical protein SAMD00019534_108190 [Acytostelium subglobosum LB1]GAM27643.1 hypothetical protein SAMD00019534_108190 [Acytostelium subglobosum LB1]|eukprot:XP_012749302.1 hypothetical protein SAMD00019534_108190 [Acytostelium subglobosum LB1]